MDWVSTWEYLSGQGLLFWSAAAAVALGVTLILAAGHLQWRRLRARSATRLRDWPVRGSQTLSDPGEVPAGGEIHLQNVILPSDRPPASRVEDRREMVVLMARLRSAADRLADFEGPSRPTPTCRQDSQLKGDGNGVEYLFRAGKG